MDNIRRQLFVKWWVSRLREALAANSAYALKWKQANPGKAREAALRSYSQKAANTRAARTKNREAVKERVRRFIFSPDIFPLALQWHIRRLEARRQRACEHVRRAKVRDPEKVRARGRLRGWRKTHPGPAPPAERASHFWAARREIKAAAKFLQMRWEGMNPRESKKTQKRKEHIKTRLERSVRTRLQGALRLHQAKKVAPTFQLVGCSIPELRAHLEKQFQPGMTWENRGFYGWHIDHVQPCAAFDLSDPAQQRACFHFSNLQPLWAKDNLRKHARY